MAFEFQPKVNGTKNCGDNGVTGPFSSKYDYILKPWTGDDDYPVEACKPWVHYNVKVGNLKADANMDAGGNVTSGGNITAGGAGNFGGTVTAPTFSGQINVQSWKGFDIKHPNKKNHRLRHICLEGPEAGVFYRGRLKNSNYIQLPEYWKGLVDFESITVSLTQIGSSQDLIVEAVEWNSRIKIKSNNASNIDCYFVVHAARIDGEPLIVEYEGQTPAEYPGDDTQFSISGYDYDVRGDKSTKNN
jgi:hypothetical protein